MLRLWEAKPVLPIALTAVILTEPFWHFGHRDAINNTFQVIPSVTSALQFLFIKLLLISFYIYFQNQGTQR